MALTTLSPVYCTEDDLKALLSTDGEVGRLDDDANGALNTQERGYLTKAIAWASARVNFYLLQQYSATELSGSWLVNEWATVLAAHWLSCRRGNPVAAGVAELYEGVVKDMEGVRSGAFQLPDAATRDVCWPAWSNCRVDLLYALRKVRVERPISEKSSTQGAYVRNGDPAANFIVEPNG